MQLMWILTSEVIWTNYVAIKSQLNQTVIIESLFSTQIATTSPSDCSADCPRDFRPYVRQQVCVVRLGVEL